MCGGTAFTGTDWLATAATGGYYASLKWMQNATQPPKPPDPLAPPPPPQAPKAPDIQAIRRDQKERTAGGYGSTLLTGMGGVAPGSLNLGRNTLLGA